MTEPGIEVHVDATSRALNKLAAQIEDRRMVNRQLAIQMSSWIARNFTAEGALNVAWAQLQPSTANAYVTKTKYSRGPGLKPERIRRGYHPILAVSGLLRDSFANFGYDNDSATVGTNITYAPFHEQGVPEKNLPARPMLPTKDIALQDAVDLYGMFIRKAKQGAGL